MSPDPRTGRPILWQGIAVEHARRGNVYFQNFSTKFVPNVAAAELVVAHDLEVEWDRGLATPSMMNSFRARSMRAMHSSRVVPRTISLAIIES